MTRAVGLIVLLAFALTIPCAHICSVKSSDGEAIAALDICSPDSPGTSGQTVTLVEPAYDMQVFVKTAILPSEKPMIYESKVFSPLDRPPLA